MFWSLLIQTNNFVFRCCSISALSCSFEFVWVGGWIAVVGGGFQRLILSQPNFSYGCFVVGVVVVVGL